MSRPNHCSWKLLTFTALLHVGATAQAASVSYFLNQSNINASPLVDGVNYAQVTIDDNVASTLTFTVTILSPLTSIAATNFGIQEFGFNVLGTSNPLSDASGTNAQWTLPTGWSANVAPPPNQLDGFGRFEVSVSTTGSGRLSPLVFSLQNTGLTINSFFENSTNNAAEGNQFFAAHITGFSQTAGATSGYFGGSTPVPVPAAMWLLASALGGMGLLRRRRRDA